MKSKLILALCVLTILPMAGTARAEDKTPQGSPAPAATDEIRGAHAPSATPQAPSGKIEPLKGGQIIEELYKGKKDLSGKEVAVRGRVAKANRGIMGKNWYHLQDGSGTAGTNDITVTTADEAKVGDVVVARGKLILDKDFGMGYKYDLLIEDGKITRE